MEQKTRAFFNVVDELFARGEFDAVAMYVAFTRCAEQGEPVTVEGFCRRFGVSRDKFYRLADILWRYGLLEVTKTSRPGGGWINCYTVRTRLQPSRAGSFRRRSSGNTREKLEVSGCAPDRSS